MAEQPDMAGVDRGEEEVWIAIEAFEKILEAMPSDRASLEALSHAYEQVGDHTRAKDYLLRLGQVVIEERDGRAAAHVAEHLQPYVGEDDRVATLQASLVELSEPGAVAGEAAPVIPAAAPPASEDAGCDAFNLADELSFAWTLMETDQLSQEEYAAVVQDLTDMSSGDAADTISVLHALEFRAFKNLDRVLATVSKECGTPLVALGHFMPPHDALEALPLDFMLRRGAVVFDFIGKDALVVVMNPYDKPLRKRISTLTGRKCHFFMAVPSEFDSTLGRLRDRQSGEEEVISEE